MCFYVTFLNFDSFGINLVAHDKHFASFLWWGVKKVDFINNQVIKQVRSFLKVYRNMLLGMETWKDIELPCHL
jgi:hypothetical protein